MSNLTELTTQIVSARVAKKEMSKEELLDEMQMIYTFLKNIEEGNVQPQFPAQETAVDTTKERKLNFKQIFKKDEVICLLCNKGFKTLKRHLSMAHGLKPGEYRKQFDIPAKQSLVAKSYSDKWRQAANARGQGEVLAKAREAKAVKILAAAAEKTKPPVPAVKEKAPVPVLRVKASVPARTSRKK